MRYFTTKEQTRTLNKSYELAPVGENFSIGELISVLPFQVTYENVKYSLNIMPWNGQWLIRYSDLEGSSICRASRVELVDALFEIIENLNTI